jgi:alpha-glucosidase (family GH31 glycosyl hydrolase)
MPPFWSLGFHQSKWGYNNVSALTDVMQKYQDYQIPLDVIWSDIDYMVGYLPFTVDNANFPAESLKASLAKFGKKWVPIVDPGIGTSAIAENFAYKRGKQMDIFLKNKSGKYFEGWVWANRSVFPDFFHPQAEEYWLEMLHELDNKVPFDGIWLDMNEIANFCNGTCNRTSKATPLYDTIPFLPGNISLEHKTTDLEAVHYGNIKEFDAHSLFNLLQQKATYRYLKTKTPLPFILTRANVFGSGQFASHWFGDPSSEWIELRNSIAGTLRYNLFGMPHNGADICGYTGTPTPELCTRWTQLGVFYTFARNHHEKKTGNQEPFVFEDRYRVPMTEAIRFRYSILKHFYTLFVSKGGLGTLIKPLFFEFPDDQKLLRLQNINGVRYVEEQFMVGKSMMVAPVLYPAMDVVDVYFPENACWYNLFTYELVNSFGGDRIRSTFAPMNTMIPVFIRGGFVIMMQDSRTVMSTKDLNNVFSMVIALPETSQFNVHDDSSMVTYTHSAKGEILDIVDYEEVTVYTQCLLEEEDCVLKINVEFSWNILNNRLKVVVQTNRRKIPGIVPEGTSGNVTTNEIKILGDMMKILNTSGGVGTVRITNTQNLSEVITVNRAQIVNDALIISANSSDGGGILLSEGSKYVIEN